MTYPPKPSLIFPIVVCLSTLTIVTSGIWGTMWFCARVRPLLFLDIVGNVYLNEFVPLSLGIGVLFLDFFLLRGWTKKWTRYSRFRNGACIECGYDLRAHNLGGSCPECGTPIPLQPATIVPTKGNLS